MKTLQSLALFCAFVSCVAFRTDAVFAQTKSETVKVWGNCGMCKKTIEKSLKGVDGVQSATWNKTTKMLAVNYEASKITLAGVEQKVAASGYDTQNVKANDGAYSKLPECCQYDRKK
jgi:periplasmic mercuric ion binding protein